MLFFVVRYSEFGETTHNKKRWIFDDSNRKSYFFNIVSIVRCESFRSADWTAVLVYVVHVLLIVSTSFLLLLFDKFVKSSSSMCYYWWLWRRAWPTLTTGTGNASCVTVHASWVPLAKVDRARKICNFEKVNLRQTFSSGWWLGKREILLLRQ